ncbi:aspartate kinase [candidate division KSB1 bacterium]|nr:aspartate kinase [candidate division KSB1 bacterium]
MIVMKFGGASLRDPDSILKVGAIIASRINEQPVAVISAVNGVTNRLVEATNSAFTDEGCIPDILNSIAAIHRKLAAGAISSPPIRTSTQLSIDQLLARLERVLYGIAYTGECTPRTRDLILTFGERMSVHLLAGHLNSIGCAAQSLYADEIDMVAHGPWSCGTTDREQVRNLLPPHIISTLEKGMVPVITGYFGRTKQHQPITFGRGGTDYSAGVIADAINASQLEVWKDVDGFLSVAPEISKKGKLLKYLSYDEAAELSYFGAKILHPRTVEPLFHQNIPLLIKNVYNPESEGTHVGPERHTHEHILKSVTFDTDIAVLRIYGAGVGYQVGLLKTFVSSLSDFNINIKSVITSQTCINLLVEHGDLEESHRRLTKLKSDFVDVVEAVDDLALVGVVGEGLAETPGLAARIFSVVARSNTNIEMISSGASRVAFYFLVKKTALKTVVKAIHDEFFDR